MTVICLDFDGVVINSIDECYETSWRAYAKWKGVPATPDPDRAAFFGRVRKHVRPAGQYWVLHHAYDAGLTGLDEVAFGRLVEQHAATIRTFEPLFFGERNAQRAADLSGWLALNPPYDGAREGIRSLMERGLLYIVTTKDGESVRLLMDHFGIGFDPDRIHGKERHENKAEAIRAISQETRVDPDEILFLDDHPDHLKDVAVTGAECVWASWGYYDHRSGFEGPPVADWPAFMDLVEKADRNRPAQ